MRSLLLLLLLVSLSASSADVVQMRGGLPNFFKRLARCEAGEKNDKGEALQTRIVYFGGSITAGSGASKPELCYRALLQKHIRSLYPKAVVHETNAAIGGTGSWLGAFRVKADVFDHWINGDLVVVEFAVNDGNAPETQVYGSMEGIVRQIRERYPDGEILFVYTLVKGHLDDFKKGSLPDRIQWHEKIAAHYNIPSVNMAQYAAEKIFANELSIDDFAKDGVHPTDRGYAMYLDALKPFIAQCKTAAEKPGEIVKYALPQTKFSPRSMDRAKMVPYDRVDIDDKCKPGQESPADKFLHVMANDTPGATATIRFKGESLGYYDVIGPDTGDLEISIDGGEWKAKPNYDAWCKGGFRPHCRVVVEELDPNAEHSVKIRVAEQNNPESKGRFFRPAFFLVNGDLVNPDPYKGMSALQKIDAIYAKMEPVKYVSPPDRWKLMPETMKKLNEGPALRIVMLGDSIVNDTSSSQYEHLLMRQYPKCKIEKITSVRGSTGCWWYKDENRVQEWVLKHKPDLLMIGGISQRDDIDAIREVIKQTRAGAPSVEVFLMTGAFGYHEPKKDKTWSNEIDPNSATYRAKLMKLAAEEKCEFLDMTGAWGQYIQASDKAMGCFKRDPIHANERGFQILGRILEKYFGAK